MAVCSKIKLKKKYSDLSKMLLNDLKGKYKVKRQAMVDIAGVIYLSVTFREKGELYTALCELGKKEDVLMSEEDLEFSFN